MKALFFFLFSLILLTACTQEAGKVIIDKPIDTANLGGSFKATNNTICMQEGKPIVREFATSWCPHCAWVKPVYQQVVKEYAGKISAYQWEVDTGNNLLTEELEFEVPANEMNIFEKFNPNKSIPTFIIGCKYVRIGNAFEEQNDKKAEATELRAVIDKILKEAK